VDLDVQLTVSYPSGMGSTYQNEYRTFTPKVHLQLGRGGVGAVYRALFLAGSIGGALVLIASGALLNRLTR
jgi:hypothetical protein